MTQKMDFTVIGEQKIHCAGCEQRIGNAIRGLRGVQDMQASAETQRVVVSFDPAHVTPDQVRAKTRGARLPRAGSPSIEVVLGLFVPLGKPA